MSMQIKSFQDLNIWKEAHQLTLEIYKITNKFPKAETFGLISQIQRAAVSVAANIVEGMGRNTTKELLSFAYNARGSLMDLYPRYNGLAKGINVFIAKLKNKIN